MVYELTCPFESNIHKQHKYKSDKYAHFETDVKQYHTKVVAFKVGSRGVLTPDNIQRLSYLHKHYISKHIKKNFISNISALASLSSYYIFTARKQASWEHTDHLTPPL